jgi:integrase
MARKRQYGSGQLVQVRKGWVIRWRENEIAPDGRRRRVLRYEQLGPMSRREAATVLGQRLASAADPKAGRSRVQFAGLVAEWERTVVPMYKPSTQKNHRHIVAKHLVPRFGSLAITDVTTQTIQAYVAKLTSDGYAPKTIDHIHDVLSAILRTAVTWGHLGTNPARGVSMPTLRTVRPKWALTREQARALLEQLPPLARTMVGVALLTGLRRGELFALRWKAVDLDVGTLHVQEAVYEGMFGTPKTAAGSRTLPLPTGAVTLLRSWRARVSRREPDDLVFATVTGKPISPNNVLRRWVFPACEKLQLARTSWLTFRRTYSSWAHEHGIPGKVVAELMGHAKVDTTLNVYTQVIDGAKVAAARVIGNGLNGIERNLEGTAAPIH